MRVKSIKKNLPRMTRFMVVILILLIVPVNIFVQLLIVHANQQDSSLIIFSQLEQLMDQNKKDIEDTKKEYRQRCIQSAEAVAYYVQHDPEVLESVEECQKLAEKLDVDEIHFFSPSGEIVSGTHPNYYGFTFESGEQMNFFLPMLDDATLKLCQEVMPNTAEGKKMQYAAVWLEDGSGIIQIGMEPKRLLQEISDKDYENILSSMPMDMNGYLHIIDQNTQQVIASTKQSMIGKDIGKEIQLTDGDYDGISEYHYSYQGEKFCVYQKKYDEYVLIRSYASFDPLKETLISSILVLLYIVLVAVIVISFIAWYIKKYVANNLTLIVDDLKKIENGNMENITLKTGINEFDELIFYVNQLLKSVRLNWNKLSSVIDKGQLPIGIFENNIFYKKKVVNERLLKIFNIGDSKDIPADVLIEKVQKCLDEAFKHIVDQEESVYRFERDGISIYLRIEVVEDDQSVTYYVSDVSLWWDELNLLREQSNNDALTELYNRRGFSERLNELFQEPQQLGYSAMLMIDADGLKKMNDIYGHHAGDEYIRSMARLMRLTLKEQSVAARLGGDEFAIFVYGYASLKEVEDVVMKVKNLRGEKFDYEHFHISETIEFSVGEAYYPMDGIDYHLLMHLADKRMYEEKRNRKENCFKGKNGGSISSF